ncbi:MAG: TetR/AcrR family transcriptional regulator [Mycobacteriales bacterium]
MLDAAAALLDEQGLPGPTTSQIAAHASVSVGSLYQFFPDQRAVLQALADRSFQRFRELLGQRLAACPPQQWRDVVEVVVDSYVEFTGTEPAARVLSFGGPMDMHLQLDDDNNAVVTAALTQLIEGVVPGLVVDSRLELRLRVAVEAADSVLDLAFRQSPKGDPAVVAEAKRVVVAYLAEHLDR